MVKIILALTFSLLLAVLLLQLRQQRMEMNYATHKLHREIETSQSRLWNQQLEIAARTSPPAVVSQVNEHGLKLVPRQYLPANVGTLLGGPGAMPTVKSQ